ncbi:hypothetical protein LXL04_030229 [Taraxacum kok-saghyz]
MFDIFCKKQDISEARLFVFHINVAIVYFRDRKENFEVANKIDRIVEAPHDVTENIELCRDGTILPDPTVGVIVFFMKLNQNHSQQKITKKPYYAYHQPFPNMNTHFVMPENNQITDPSTLYGPENQTHITVRLVHGGKFTSRAGLGGRMYAPRKITYIEFVNIALFSHELLQQVMTRLGYKEHGFFYRKDRNEGMDYGMHCMRDVSDFQEFHANVYPNNCKLVHTFYVETGTPTICVSYPMSLRYASPDKIRSMLIDFVYEKPLCTLEESSLYLLSKYGVEIPDARIIPGLKLARIEEVFEETNFPLELHDASNKEDDIFSFPNGINGDSHNENNGFDFRQSLVSQNIVKQPKVYEKTSDKNIFNLVGQEHTNHHPPFDGIGNVFFVGSAVLCVDLHFCHNGVQIEIGIQMLLIHIEISALKSSIFMNFVYYAPWI